MASPTLEAMPARPRSQNHLWNFFTLGGDIAFFTLALNIASVYTIYPLFAAHLGADNTLVSLIPSIRALGVFAPQLIIASLVERVRRVKPLVLTLTIGERAPALILGVAALALAQQRQAVTLGVFLAMTLIPALCSGLTFPAWYDWLWRAIPQRWMGRFLGLWSGIGGALGALGALGATALIATYAYPLNFALCFFLSFAAYVVSFALLALGREPARARAVGSMDAEDSASAPAEKGSEEPRGRLAAQLAILRTDARFVRYLVANAISGVATMGAGLFAVAAARQGGLSDADVGAEGIVLIVAMTLGSVVWGLVGDHFGHRAPLVWGSVGAAASAGLALVAHGVWWYGAVFCLLGLSVSAMQLMQLTATGEFAPRERRASYIALMSVTYAPLAVTAPLVGGWLADRWGYGLVFGLTAGFGALAALAFGLWRPPAAEKGATRPATVETV